MNTKQIKQISEKTGFTKLHTESVSSKVFVKDGYIFKLNSRNSINRAYSDFETLKNKLVGFENHLPETEIFEAMHEDTRYTCISQPKIEGKEIKMLEKDELLKALTNNKNFLVKLLEYFFSAIENCELYPDIVGYPTNPEYCNSINLMLDSNTQKLILCDVGLSPHEDTLIKNGLHFYEGENVRVYVEKMRKFEELVKGL